MILKKGSNYGLSRGGETYLLKRKSKMIATHTKKNYSVEPILQKKKLVVVIFG